MENTSTCAGACHCADKKEAAPALAIASMPAVPLHHRHTHTHDHTSFKDYLKQYSWLLVTLGAVVVFAVIATIITSLEIHVFMQYLMAGYFLAFGIMQTISLKKSAAMLRQYDPLARKFRLYSFAYPLIQLGFGFAYLFWISPLIINGLAMLFIAVNTLGVIEVLAQKKEVRCGCLGNALKVPVSFVTLSENVVMLLMTAGMFIYFLANFIPATANPGEYDQKNHGGHFHRSI